MYEIGGIISIMGVAFSVCFIVFFLWFVNFKIVAKTQQEWLTKFTALLLSSLLGLFIVDKVVSYGTPLLNDSVSEGLFDLIKNIVLVIFGYQFNSGSKEEK
jgi:hypothetical protein